MGIVIYVKVYIKIEVLKTHFFMSFFDASDILDSEKLFLKKMFEFVNCRVI